MPRLSPVRRHPAEAGYMLISVMILLAIFLIVLAVGVPKVAESIQRDRDLETMHRGKQYIRAIQLYYRKFKAYPPNIDALVKSNEIRFLRKKYVDPTTGKEEWKPIMYCQNKTPMAMGFFGQPLAGAGCGALAGTGPGGGNGGAGGASLLVGAGTAAGSTSGGLFSNTGATAAGSGGPGTDPGAGAGAVDANGSPINTTGSPLGNGTSPTFGGGGIVGVEPASPKQSILIYKKKNHYNEWEFLYSPMSDQQMIAGGNAGGLGQQPPNGATSLFPPGGGVNQQGGGLNQGGGGLNQGGGGLNQTGGGGGNNNGSTPILPPETTAPPQ